MINGWIMLNKPKGFTSNYCINFIKKKFQIKKIGTTSDSFAVRDCSQAPAPGAIS